jgi:TP901 family phage tail tape measure protein
MATQREILELLMRTSGEADVAALRAAIDQLGAQSEESAAQAGKLEGELNRLAGVASDVAKAVTLKGALNETTAQLEAAKKGLEELNEQFSATDRSSPAVNRAFRQAEKAVADLTARQREQQLELTKTTNALKKAGVDTDNLAKEYDRLEREVRDSTGSITAQATQLTASQKAAQQLAARYEELSGSLRSAAGRVNEIGGSLVKLGAAAGTALAGLAAFGATRLFQAGIKDAADFESALGRIQATSGLSAEEVGNLKREIESIGADASKGVLEAAAAVEQLVREGLSAADAQAQLRSALDFSTAAGLDTAAAVKLLADATGAFNESINESGRVADVLVAGALKAGQAVGEYAQSIKTLGPAAADAGLDLTDTSAIIARLAQSGIEGGRAVAAFTQVLGALRDPASAFSKELDKLGIETRDFNEVLVELGKRGPQAETALLALGDRGTLAMRALARDGGQSLQALRAELDGATGAASRAAGIINADLSSSAARLQQAFADARRELVEPLLQPLATEIDSFAKAIRTFVDGPDFARIRDELPRLFGAAAQAVREFVSDVDFSEVSQRVADFAAQAGEQLRGFADNVSDVNDTVVAGARTISLVVDGFQAFVNATAAVISAILQAGAQLDVTLAGLRVASTALVGSTEAQLEAAQNLERAQNLASAFAAAAERNYEDLGRNIAEAVDAFDRLAGTAETSGRALKESLDQQGAAAAKTAPVLRDLTETVAAYEAAVRSAAGAGDANAAAIQRQGSAASTANEAAKSAAAASADVAAASTQAAAASQSAASASQAAASANRTVAATASDAAQSSKDAAGAADEQAASMNNLTLALFETSEAGLRAYMDANRKAIVSARAFADAVNEVTARIRQQEKDAESYLQSLRAQTKETDELAVRIERLREKYRLLSDAKLREIAIAEQKLARENEAYRLDADRSFRAIQAAKDRAQAEIEADNSIAANRQRLADAALSRPDAAVKTPAPTVGASTVVNVTVNGLIGGDRQEFIRQLARELEIEFRRLGLLAR